MPESPVFTPLGEPSLEARVRSDLAVIARRVEENLGNRLSLLLLGGGYGRGEGGGYCDSGGSWRAYNDYDLLAIVRGVAPLALPALRTRLGSLACELERELGLEVEISPLRREELPRLPFTMMWCELFGAHRILVGKPLVPGDLPPMPPAELPMEEGVRYLTNRGALLLWALREELPPDRVWKFVHKAWLAAGAAVLIGQRRFDIGYSRRQSALEKLEPAEVAMPLLAERHAQAVKARLRPQSPPGREELDQRLDEAREGLLAAWRWLEERRAGRPLTSWPEYAERRGLFQEPVSRFPGLLLRQVRSFGASGLRPLYLSREHPRTRVSRVLPLLLAARETAPAASRLLGCAPDWPAAASKCLEVWRTLN